MKINILKNSNSVYYALLALAGGLIILFLTIRSYGLYPTVFADEYAYSMLSRKMPLESTPIPGYLYLGVYSLSSLCGDSFLSCVRYLNVIFYVLGCIVIYLVSVNFLRPKYALIVSVFSMLAPAAGYTAYFMPESFYFLGFWCLVWGLLSLESAPRISKCIVVGLMFGMLSLIKPHALLIAPAVFLFVAYAFKFKGLSGFAPSIVFAMLTISIGFFTKFVVGYLLAGERGITLFGSVYNSIASSGIDINNFLEITKNILISILGNLWATSYLFGLPLFLLTIFFVFRDNFTSVPSNTDSLFILVGLFLLNFLFVVSIFSALAITSGPFESIYRLHLRYYNFSFPFFVLISTIFASQNIHFRSGSYIPIFFAAFSFLVVWTVFKKTNPFIKSPIDNPDLWAIHVNTGFFSGYGLALAFLVILASYRIKLANRIFIFAIFPIALFVSNYYIGNDQWQHSEPDVYDRAGIFARDRVDFENRDKIIVVGENPSGVHKSLFHIDNQQATFIIDNSGNYSLINLPENKTFVLYVGDRDFLPLDKYQIYKSDGFAFGVPHANTR